MFCTISRGDLTNFNGLFQPAGTFTDDKDLLLLLVVAFGLLFVLPDGLK